MKVFIIAIAFSLLIASAAMPAANCLHSQSWQCQGHHSNSGQASQNSNTGVANQGTTPDPQPQNPHLGTAGTTTQAAKPDPQTPKMPPKAPVLEPPKTPYKTPPKTPQPTPSLVPQPMQTPPKAPVIAPPKTPYKTPPKTPQPTPSLVPQPMQTPPKAPVIAPPKTPYKTPPKTPQPTPSLVPRPMQTPIIRHSLLPHTPPKRPQLRPIIVPQPMQAPPKIPVIAPFKAPYKTPPKMPQPTPSLVPQIATPNLPSKTPGKAPGKTPQKRPQLTPVLVPTLPPNNLIHSTGYSGSGPNVQQVIIPAKRPAQAHNGKPMMSPPLNIDHRSGTPTHTLQEQVGQEAAAASGFQTELVEPGIENTRVEVYRSNNAKEALYQDTIPMDKTGFFLTVIGIKLPNRK